MTPGWPIPYAALEPFYCRAETLYRVRGDASADPTEPPHSTPYPYPPVPDEPDIATLRLAFTAQGLHETHGVAQVWGHAHLGYGHDHPRQGRI